MDRGSTRRSSIGPLALLPRDEVACSFAQTGVRLEVGGVRPKPHIWAENCQNSYQHHVQVFSRYRKLQLH